MRFSPLLIFHICAGIVGLLSGAIALTFRKGSRGHRVAGNVFFLPGDMAQVREKGAISDNDRKT